jgi:RNA polymerase sigma factor (sigma-70 family)
VSLAKTAQRDQAIAAVVVEQRGKVLSVIKRMLPNQAEAEEVMQDVFAEFVEAYDVGTAFEVAGAWLVKVAKNKVLDRFRRKKIQDEYQSQIEAEGEKVVQPEQDKLQNLLREEIIEAIESLPEEQKEVFVQHELEGKSFEEISQETGVAINTLLSRKRYAILSLREYLKELYDEI